MTFEDKRTLKTYAANQDKTVAKVVREWIDEKCKGGELSGSDLAGDCSEPCRQGRKAR